MDDLPYNVPILLRSHHGTDLHGLHGLDVVRSTKLSQGTGSTSSAMSFSVVLHRLDKDTAAIQLFRNKRLLAVDDGGDCRFEDVALASLADRHKFRVEIQVIPKTLNHLFFVSVRTGKVLQSHSNGNVRCECTNRLEWEAWTVVELGSDTSAIGMGVTNHQIQMESERRSFIREMIQLGKSLDEIHPFLAIMYPPSVAPVATAVDAAKH